MTQLQKALALNLRDDLKVSPLEEPVQIDPTSIVNDSNEENVNNMTSVDAYIYKKNKDNSN